MFTMALVWSAMLYGACWASAPFVASAMGSASAVPLIRVLGIAVLVDAVAAVPSALMTRAFRQRQRMAIDLICILTSAVISIWLAARGLGAWALVWGALVSSVMSGVMTFWWSPERYWPGFDRSAVRELLIYGLPLAGASALLFLTLNVDYLVVGHQLGSAALGYYALAFNVSSWPVNLVSVAIRRVSFAGFSRLAEGGTESSDAFVRVFALVLAVTIPLCALLAAYARPAIAVIYGEKWLPAVDAVGFLSILGGARVALELGYDYFAAIGRTSANLILQGLWFVLLVPALTLGAGLDGIRGVATAHAVVAVLVIVPVFLFILRRRGIHVQRLVRFSIRPGAAGMLVLASGLVTTSVIPGDLPALFIGSAVSGLLALAVVFPMRRLIRPSVAQVMPTA